MENDNRWCFAWYATPKIVTDKERAALIKGAKWTAGDVITVSFLDGDPAVCDKVKNHARQWTAPGLANLTLDFRDGNDTDVRISFHYPGSWSVIGTTCRMITDRTQPTMNFGWLTPDTDEMEVRRVVLHEFGHALGLIHEHQNPAGGIKWNQVEVIRSLSGPPNNWDIPTISRNMFEPYGKDDSNFTAVDKGSIMMYPIPPGWTTDGFTVGLNSDLSDTDKQFIHEQYP